MENVKWVTGHILFWIWAGDITSIWTNEDWLYLSVIIDLFSRRIVEWATSNRVTKELVIDAMPMATGRRRISYFILIEVVNIAVGNFRNYFGKIRYVPVWAVRVIAGTTQLLKVFLALWRRKGFLEPIIKWDRKRFIKYLFWFIDAFILKIE